MFTIKTDLYLQQIQRWPRQGQHILAHQNDSEIVVYQAYNHAIADYAVENQHLGGSAYSYNRMSWIKPNFLWMMYRCGWAMKENQERVLALWLSKGDFELVLNEAVFSSYHAEAYPSQTEWKADLERKAVRLQWDPDHDPFGKKQERRAIQLGLKGEVLREFGKRQITRIEDVTPFVKEQKRFLELNQLDKLLIPAETIFKPKDIQLGRRLGIAGL